MILHYYHFVNTNTMIIYALSRGKVGNPDHPPWASPGGASGGAGGAGRLHPGGYWMSSGSLENDGGWVFRAQVVVILWDFNRDLWCFV